MNVGQRLRITFGLAFRIMLFEKRLKFALKRLGICFRMQSDVGVEVIKAPVTIQLWILEGANRNKEVKLKM